MGDDTGGDEKRTFSLQTFVLEDSCEEPCNLYNPQIFNFTYVEVVKTSQASNLTKCKRTLYLLSK